MTEARRQMTFSFDATACSGCRCCQIACKDRNDLETGRLWRRVYEVAGGTWQRQDEAWRNDVFASSLSISCNHCERPICAEGCPARAITKRFDGIVLLDESRCLGCGYCAWGCPYDAPQYHADAGHMSKCSFCVEDLDAGREPACVAACPVRALDCGVPQELAAKPGFSGDTTATGIHPLPDPGLTEPALLLRAHRDAARGDHEPVEVEPGPPRGLREWSLVAFTLLGQLAAGLSLSLMATHWWIGQRGDRVALDRLEQLGLPLVSALILLAMALSLLHLGSPLRASRAVLNLRFSWLSREILLAVLFLVTGLLAAGGHYVRPDVRAIAQPASAICGLLFVWGMSRVYMLRTVPVWNRPSTILSFLGTSLLLGGLLTGALLSTVLAVTGQSSAVGPVIGWLAWLLVVLIAVRRRAGFYGSYRRVGI
jgi:anaerobic dimethyl sulfoxide reductase subunit B (iron-sulfur subunit)